MIQKIYRSILLVSFITFSACFVIITGIFYDYFSDKLQLELKGEAAFAARGVELVGEEYFRNLETDTRLTWIAADGNVLYDNKTTGQTLTNHLDRAEVQQALEEGEGYSERFSDTLSQKTVNYAVLLSDGTVLRVSNTQYTVWVLLASMFQPAAVLILVILVLAIAITLALSKKIVRQINDIDLEKPALNDNYEELAPLIGRIDRQNRLIRRQMADLKSRQEEFHAITENMSEGFILMDRHYNLLSYNSAAAKVFLLDQENASAIEASPAIKKLAERVLNGEHVEDRISLNNRDYQLLANPVYADEQINGLVVVVLDITEKEQQEQMRREFTSNVSHELKTPLTTIYGVSEMLMSGMIKQEDIPKFAANIHDETGRMITLVNDIIRLSQLDENAISHEKEPVDLFAVANDVVMQLSGVAAASNITLSLTGEPSIVSGIPAILHEMIYNLCDNAIKYNRENGSVMVDVKNENGTVTLSVSDTGIGIPPEHIDRVFERFYRVDKSHSRQNGGTGLGLSIVKHGAAYHNARLQMESRVGEGTDISILFKETV